MLFRSALWHNRLGHASLHLLSKLHTKGLVCGLPPITTENQSNCVECMKGKQVRSSFKSKNDVTSKAPLELLHMDLCGPMRVQSPGGARYMFVIVDDYSRFTWTIFLRSKDEVHSRFSELVLSLEKSLSLSVRAIRSDHGTEFENAKMLTFCREKGTKKSYLLLTF